MAGPIAISIIGDNRGLSTSLDQSQSKLSKLGGIASTAGKVVAGGMLVAGAAAVAFGVSAVRSASDAQQSIGATETVFGRFSDRVVKDSEKASTTFGLSANQYRENANLIGSLFKNQGVAADQLAGKTKGMIGTAADLAATFGGPTSDAVEALGSAFKGEFDPLERYGISIKQSSINAELAAKGQDKLTGAALKAAQQQATSRLIMEQSSASIGAFGRETGTLAHQQQVLGANFDNIKAKVGGALLPALTAGAAAVNDQLFPALEKAGPVVSDLANRVGARLSPAFDAAKGAVAGALPVYAQLGRTWLTVAGSLVTGLLPPLTSAAGFLARTFGPVISSVAHIITGQLVPGAVAVGRFFATQVVPIIARTATAVGKNLAPAFQQIAGSLNRQVLPAVSKGADKFRDWWPTIQKVVVITLKVTGALVVFAAKVLGVVLPPVIRFAGFMAGTMIKSIVGAISVIVRIGAAVVNAGAKFVGAIASVGRFASAVVGKVGDVIKTVAGLPGKAAGALGNLGGTLAGAGRQLIQGFIDGIGDMFGNVQGKLGELTGKLTSWKGPPKRDKVLLRPAGRTIIKGLVDGFTDGYSGVQSWLGKLTSYIQKRVDLKDNKAEKRREGAIIAHLSKQYDLLRQNGRAQDANNRKLDAARVKLKAVVDFASSVKAGALDFANITGAGTLDDNGSTTAGSITQGLHERLSAIVAFNEQIAALTKAGLNRDAIGEIIAEGVDGGLATAQALTAGGSAAIKEVNTLTAQIAGAAGQLATTGASAMYDGGVKAAEGLVSGLEAAGSKLDAAAKRLAGRLAASLQRELKGAGTGAGKKAGGTAKRLIDSTHTTKRAALSDAAKRGGVGAGARQSITVKLTAEQLTALQRGKAIRADLDVYEANGGRRK